MTARIRRPFGLLVVALLMPATPRAQAQSVAPRLSGLRGTVVDALDGTPLAAATVSLEPLPGGVVAPGHPGSAGLLATARQSVTTDDGAYAFVGLPPGEYRVRVMRIGYRSATIEVHYDGPADSRVSIGLELSPVELEPLVVPTRRSMPLTASRGERRVRVEDERVRAERLRQMRYLTPDTRVVTDADVVEAVTVGETDLLRALHHLPGVTAEDDWSAEPWTRGSNWDETRIFFDGLPLFDPMHLLGAFASFNPDAVGSLTFHPGVRPVDVGDASAAVVDLRSRPASGEDHLTALGQISAVSARFSLDRPYGAANGLTLSGRRSVIEDLTRWEGERRSSDYLPYEFTDLMGRWDQALGAHSRLVVSGLRNRDRVFGDIPHRLKGARGEWGNTALRGAFENTSHGLRTRVGVGRSTFASDIEVVPFDASREDLSDAGTAAPTFNRVRSEVAELTVAPLTRNGEPATWEIGARRVETRVSYDGPAPWPYPDAANAGRLEHRSEIERFAYWGQLRGRLAPEVEASAGLRIESNGRGGGSVADVEAAPRISLAWTPGPDLRVSAAVGRHHQYEQALAATAFTVGSGLVPAHLWVSAHGGIPAIRADLATVGAELWLPRGWLASATAYVRSSTGRLTPAPDSGEVRARPPLGSAEPSAGWVAGDARAVGIELGARKLTGRWTGSVSYSLAHSRTTAEGRSYPTPGERTHSLDAAVVFDVSPRTRVGATLTASSGAAYTRFYAFRCTEVSWYCPSVDTGEQPVIGWAEAAGNERTPAYVSLDLHVERRGTLFGLPFGVYGQLRNTLARNNRGAYVGSILDCADGDRNCTLTDRFEDGFPFLPLVGIWIRM